jgi:threonine dehydratase
MAGHESGLDIAAVAVLTVGPSLSQVTAARDRIAGVAIRTPVVPLHEESSPGIHLKLEDLQPTGSFKVRGATNLVGGNIDPATLFDIVARDWEDGRAVPHPG